jgi:hypothetical protein
VATTATDWGPIFAAALALLSGLLAAWRSSIAAREAKDAKETVGHVSAKLDGVVVQLDGKLQARIEEVRVAAEAVGVLKEKERRAAEDRAVADAAVPKKE